MTLFTMYGDICFLIYVFAISTSCFLLLQLEFSITNNILDYQPWIFNICHFNFISSSIKDFHVILLWKLDMTAELFNRNIWTINKSFLRNWYNSKIDFYCSIFVFLNLWKVQIRFPLFRKGCDFQIIVHFWKYIFTNRDIRPLNPNIKVLFKCFTSSNFAYLVLDLTPPNPIHWNCSDWLILMVLFFYGIIIFVFSNY